MRAPSLHRPTAWRRCMYAPSPRAVHDRYSPALCYCRMPPRAPCQPSCGSAMRSGLRCGTGSRASPMLGLVACICCKAVKDGHATVSAKVLLAAPATWGAWAGSCSGKVSAHGWETVLRFGLATSDSVCAGQGAVPRHCLWRSWQEARWVLQCTA